MTSSVQVLAAAVPVRAAFQSRLDPGRFFVGPVFDYLLIGGGLSLLLAAGLDFGAAPYLSRALETQGPLVLLLCNAAHFAASTVRLYTKPGARRDLPLLTMALPLAAVLAVTVAVAFPGVAGRHMWSLYVTWSPFHYSAQAYGLAVMYCYRSGGIWSDSDKRWLRAACLCPFVYVFVGGPGQGLDWLLPDSVLQAPGVGAMRMAAAKVLAPATFLLPLLILLRHQRPGRARFPVISVLILVANGIWLVRLGNMGAFIWATIFHGIQYLAIVSIFHVKDRGRGSDNGRPAWRHAVSFYLVCVAAGYLMFQAWPHAYALLGFGVAESVIVVVAAINLHHFIVDAFIWRLRRDPNYATVQANPATST